MASAPAAGFQTDLPSSALVGYFLLTFLIAWGLLGIYVFFPAAAVAGFGEISGSHPVFVVATWSPAIAGFVVVLRHSGTTGVRALLSRLLLWGCPASWAAFTLIGLPLAFVAGSLFKGGALLAALPPEGSGRVVAALLLMLFLGPIEEFGWRGVAQPVLQRHMAPFWAGLLIGTVWGLWHLPAFFLSGTVFAGWSFLPFFAGNVALAVLLTQLFNRTRGSLLWPMLFHWQLINPFWPDAQPWDTWLLAGAALLVVLSNRDGMFVRGRGVTVVLPAPPIAAFKSAS